MSPEMYLLRSAIDLDVENTPSLRLAAYNAFSKEGERIPLPEIIETTLKTKGFDATKKRKIQLPKNKVNIDAAFFYGISYYSSGIINFAMLIDSAL